MCRNLPGFVSTGTDGRTDGRMDASCIPPPFVWQASPSILVDPFSQVPQVLESQAKCAHV
eukprot:12882630-Prorocentrum_lima.AAC.1